MRSWNLSAWAIGHRALVLALLIAITLGGAYAYLGLGRAEDPSFTIKTAIVTAAWPGATAEQMADQVADPMEKKLRGLAWIDFVQTYSVPGFAVLTVYLQDGTPAREVARQFYQLRKKLDDLRPELPPGIVGPAVNDEFGETDSVLYAVTGEGADDLQLKQMAEALGRRLERVPAVEKINYYGEQAPRIWIEFSHAKLATLGIPPQALFDSLARQNAVAPAGIVETGAQRIPLRVTGAIDGLRAVAETPVAAGGRVLRLGDIANAWFGTEDPPQFRIRAQGKKAVVVGVVMRKGGNILRLGDDLRAAMAEFQANLPVGFSIGKIADQPLVVAHALTEFMRSFLEALAIVLAVSFVSLGWRAGLVVAVAVPLVLAVVFLTLLLIGTDLQRISLGALIIALGLLVDDAIIAVETIMVKLEAGWAKPRAAAFAWTSTALPMLTGTLVTAAGFLPIGLARSTVGDYAGDIFGVVGIALVASWFVAVVFTPYLGVRLLRDAHATARTEQAIYDTRMYRALRRVIAGCVRRPLPVVVATGILFALGVAALLRVPQQFFPRSERAELFLELRLPAGTSIGVTDAITARAEPLLAGDADIASYTSYVGQGAPRFWLGLFPQQPDPAFGEIVIVARDLEARERVKARLQRALADGALPEARVRLDRFNFGPPVGYPVQFRVIGSDPLELRRIAYRVRDILRANPDGIDPNLDWNERMPSLRLEVDQDRARAVGLTPADIAAALQTLLNGFTVTTMLQGTERIDVVARAILPERRGLASLADLTIAVRDGVAIPLGQVARIVNRAEDAILWRRNRETVITVRADVLDGVQAPDVSNAVWPALAALRAELTPGYRIEMGGAIEESAKANRSIYALLPLMLLVTAGLLMVQLQSFSLLFLVLMTAPLGVIGAALALHLSGRPFGFVALLGMIALGGMIMRNSVILVDQIEADMATRGRSRHDAIVAATVRRARPVVLTALASILAMIPLTQSAFWGPMAFVIMGGLFVATLLTILFLPALYAVWFRRTLSIVECDAPTCDCSVKPTAERMPDG